MAAQFDNIDDASVATYANLRKRGRIVQVSPAQWDLGYTPGDPGEWPDAPETVWAALDQLREDVNNLTASTSTPTVPLPRRGEPGRRALPIPGPQGARGDAAVLSMLMPVRRGDDGRRQPIIPGASGAVGRDGSIFFPRSGTDGRRAPIIAARDGVAGRDGQSIIGRRGDDGRSPIQTQPVNNALALHMLGW